MDISDSPIGLGEHLKDELPYSKRCLEELRKIQNEMSERHQGQYEFFDLGPSLWLAAEKTVEDKLQRLTQACIWHAIALKVEFKLKFYTIDRYLSAVDAKNPVSTFLLARYLLELVATVNVIDVRLNECLNIDLRNWTRRGAQFFELLYRARHSTYDDKFKSIFAEYGIPASAFHPIRAPEAIKMLTTRDGFGSAVSTYRSLCNICHHNGSAHKMLTEGFRETKKITDRKGRTLALNEKAWAVTVGYPSSHFTLHSLTRTARVAWWSAHCANKIIEDMCETPFTDDELSTLTDGRLTSAQPYDVTYDSRSAKPRQAKIIKIGRNDPCPCGSGKKFKACCWNMRDWELGL
jgi:hypothetical protein